MRPGTAALAQIADAITTFGAETWLSRTGGAFFVVAESVMQKVRPVEMKQSEVRRKCRKNRYNRSSSDVMSLPVFWYASSNVISPHVILKQRIGERGLDATRQITRASNYDDFFLPLNHFIPLVKVKEMTVAIQAFNSIGPGTREALHLVTEDFGSHISVNLLGCTRAQNGANDTAGRRSAYNVGHGIRFQQSFDMAKMVITHH